LTTVPKLDTNVLRTIMPANPQQLHEAFNRIGGYLRSSNKALRDAQSLALGLLREAAADPHAVRARIDEAVAVDVALRCAVPADKDFAAAFDCAPGVGASTLLAVDGSQAIADRHEEVAFALINIGSVRIEQGSGKVPEVSVDTRLLFGDELLSADGRMPSEGDLALLRDAAERRALLTHASTASAAVVLVDGPLELWGAKDLSDPAAFELARRRYLDDLRELHRRGCTIAGYVDKPGADLVVRMLELGQLPTAGDRRARPLRGVSDRWLYAQILAPGQRSAVFALQSSSRRTYTEERSIHFFYLNVGRAAQAALARIEIPLWVARESRRVDELHRALLDQCAFLGVRPYPYILHRAHETARITMQDKEQIKLRLLLEMRDLGVEPEAISPKSSAKSV
jgi:hypothetical protein